MPIIVIVLMILPFTIYNFSRFQRFVLLNTNAGYAFYFGNHPIYGTNFVGILPPEMGSYQRLIPEELQTLDEAALDQELLDRAVGIIIDDPVRYILLSISRIPVYFQFWPSPDSGTISNLSRVASFALLLPFMIYGIIRSARLHYLKSLTRPLVLLLLFALLYTGIHLLTWALIRYRLPVDAVLLVPASLGIFDLYHWIKSTYRPQTKYSTSR